MLRQSVKHISEAKPFLDLLQIKNVSIEPADFL